MASKSTFPTLGKPRSKVERELISQNPDLVKRQTDYRAYRQTVDDYLFAGETQVEEQAAAYETSQSNTQAIRGKRRALIIDIRDFEETVKDLVGDERTEMSAHILALKAALKVADETIDEALAKELALRENTAYMQEEFSNLKEKAKKCTDARDEVNWLTEERYINDMALSFKKKEHEAFKVKLQELERVMSACTDVTKPEYVQAQKQRDETKKEDDAVLDSIARREVKRSEFSKEITKAEDIVNALNKEMNKLISHFQGILIDTCDLINADKLVPNPSDSRDFGTPKAAPTRPARGQTPGTSAAANAEIRAAAQRRKNVTFDTSTVFGQSGLDANSFAEAMSSVFSSSDKSRREDLTHALSRMSPLSALPKFSGIPLEFLTFKREMESSTARFDYTETENMKRLRDSLIGDAKKSVQSLLPLASGVKEIMETLETLFGSETHVTHYALEELRKVKSPQSGHQKEILAFSVAIKNIIATFRTLKRLDYLESPYLAEQQVLKLPMRLKIKWVQHKTRHAENQVKAGILAPKPPDLENFGKFMDAIGKEASAVLALTPGYSCGVSGTSKKEKTDKTKGIVYFAETGRESDLEYEDEPELVFHLQASHSNGKKKQKNMIKACSACSNFHPLFRCETFKGMNVEERNAHVRKHKLCPKCLRPNHVIKDCKFQRDCETCHKGNHNTLLHYTSRGKQTKGKGDETMQKVDSSECSKAGELHKQKPKSEATALPAQVAEKRELMYTTQGLKGDESIVLLGTIPVLVQGPIGYRQINALIDEGSTVTLINAELASEIGLEGYPQKLRLSWTDHSTQVIGESHVVSLSIKGAEMQEQSNWHFMENVRTVPALELPVQTMKTHKLKGYKHLHEVPIPFLGEVKPMMLIGQDQLHLIMTEKYVCGEQYEPVASYCKLGWAIQGCIGRPKKPDANVAFSGFVGVQWNHDFTIEDQSAEEATMELSKLVKAYFDVEKERSWDGRKLSQDDFHALSILEKTVKRIPHSKGWETGLLWKNEVSGMPSANATYQTAKKRLESLQKKFKKDPVFAKAYREKMDECIFKGYMQKLDSPLKGPKAWFLSHFAVYHPCKPGKIRIVFDAAAKTEGKCLNDFLMPGPDLLNSLVDILMRFREHPITICGDINDFFSRVRVREEDLPSHQILWHTHADDKEPSVYVYLRVPFGENSSPCETLYVCGKNAEQSGELYPEIVESISLNTYMDDYCSSVKSVEEAKRTIALLINIHDAGDFHISKFISNSKEVENSIPEKFRGGTEHIPTDLQPISIAERILGLYYSPRTDTFSFKTRFSKMDLDILENGEIPTKRNALRLIMQIFDPLGLLAFLVIRAKFIMSDVWTLKCGWDDVLPEAVRPKWHKFINLLRSCDMHIQRPYSNDIRYIELNVFTDASPAAYAAVAYFRIIRTDDTVKVVLVAAKTRTAPRKQQSVPKLELMGAELGAKLAKIIVNAHTLTINNVRFFTDSRCVFHWIHNKTKRLEVLVINRIRNILELFPSHLWYWVRSELNVADLCTKDTESFNEWRAWFYGPRFLHNYCLDFSNQQDFMIDTRDQYKLDEFLGFLKAETSCFPVRHTEPLSLPTNFTFHSLVKLTMWILKWKNIVKGSISPYIKAYPVATDTLLRHVQLLTFPQEYALLLQKPQAALPKSSKLRRLSPFIDFYGNLRVGGRVQPSMTITWYAANPIILHASHPIVLKLIWSTHVKMGHRGTQATLCELRQRYWILQARNAIRKIVSKCFFCQFYLRKTTQQQMSVLPPERTNETGKPWVNTGLDMFGPYYVKIGRSDVKRWVLLFTCLSTRAVHLEEVDTADASSAILAIMRFRDRRGYVASIITDNGSNFIGANNEIRDSIKSWNDNADLQKKMKLEQIEWKFIPAWSPNYGGVYERLIQCVKKSLYVSLLNKVVKPEEFRTFITNAEYLCNTRPHSPVSIDPDDDTPLTPNHFLIHSNTYLQPIGAPAESDIFSSKAWKRAQIRQQEFWIQWRREWIPQLYAKQKWNTGNVKVEVGNLVRVKKVDLPRGRWPVGVIVRVFPGPDNIVRTVEVKMGKDYFIRALNTLVLLDALPTLAASPQAGQATGGSVSKFSDKMDK